MSDEKPRAWHSLLAATLTIGLLAVALVMLYVLSLGTIGLAVVVGGGLFLTVGLHYLVWGWWLGPAIHREVEAEEEDENERTPNRR
ncbi:MAG TPA: hypothetical protein VHD36_14525 [Pirellulales bacterium]|nr:hypothetical protein [Pirellulales bacterium]